MQELIKVSEHKGQQLVSARDLHGFLESKQDFSTWIKSRIDKYGFVESEDFTTFHKIVERAKRKEYALTLSTAKELAMVEANTKGQQARRYFIECERKAKQPTTPLHYRRQAEHASKVPVGYFSMLSEMCAVFIAPMEQAGAPVESLDSIIPDISLGRMFCGWLRNNGYDPDRLPTYKHKTAHGIEVNAKLYPEDLIAPFRRFVRQQWIPNKAESYLMTKAPELKSYLPKLLQA